MIPPEPQYLYLTTTGRRTGQPHTIEIWFVAYDGCFYLVSEGHERSHWVQNLQMTPDVRFAVNSRSGPWRNGRARAVLPGTELDLARAVRARMDAKYGWSDGLIVELRPAE